MIEIFKNKPPKKIFQPLKRYQEVQFQQKYSTKIVDRFFERFPEEKQGRLHFKEKEIENVKLLIYERILQKGMKIKADCVGSIKEKVYPSDIIITVSYYKKI